MTPAVIIVCDSDRVGAETAADIRDAARSAVPGQDVILIGLSDAVMAVLVAAGRQNGGQGAET